MPAFSPALITIMRSVLEDAMATVPAEQATTVTKAYLAEFILKAAAGGLTSYEDLITAAVAQAADHYFHVHVKAVKPRHIVWAVASLTGLEPLTKS